jgi:hypothetical protein
MRMRGAARHMVEQLKVISRPLAPGLRLSHFFVSCSVLKGDILSPRSFLNPHLSCLQFLRIAPSFRDPMYIATDPRSPGPFSFPGSVARGDS